MFPASTIIMGALRCSFRNMAIDTRFQSASTSLVALVIPHLCSTDLAFNTHMGKTSAYLFCHVFLPDFFSRHYLLSTLPDLLGADDGTNHTATTTIGVSMTNSCLSLYLDDSLFPFGHHTAVLLTAFS